MARDLTCTQLFLILTGSTEWFASGWQCIFSLHHHSTARIRNKRQGQSPVEHAVVSSEGMCVHHNGWIDESQRQTRSTGRTVAHAINSLLSHTSEQVTIHRRQLTPTTKAVREQVADRKYSTSRKWYGTLAFRQWYGTLARSSPETITESQKGPDLPMERGVNSSNNTQNEKEKNAGVVAKWLEISPAPNFFSF